MYGKTLSPRDFGVGRERFCRFALEILGRFFAVVYGPTNTSLDFRRRSVLLFNGEEITYLGRQITFRILRNRDPK